MQPVMQSSMSEIRGPSDSEQVYIVYFDLKMLMKIKYGKNKGSSLTFSQHANFLECSHSSNLKSWKNS